MQKSERVPVKEAAALLGMAPQSVRYHMKNNLFGIPIGEVTNPSGKEHQYHIYRDRLYQHLGKAQDAPKEETA